MRQRLHVGRPGRDGHAPRSRRFRARDVEQRVADHDDVRRAGSERPARFSALQRLVEEMVAIRDLIAEGAATKESPEIEMLELDARAQFTVAREQRGKNVLALLDRIEEKAHAWKHTTTLCGPKDRMTPLLRGKRLAQACEVPIAKALVVAAAQIDAGTGGGVLENPSVRAARHLNAVECARNAEKIVEREVHRAAARAVCSNQRAVDVEENDRAVV